MSTIIPQQTNFAGEGTSFRRSAQNVGSIGTTTTGSVEQYQNAQRNAGQTSPFAAVMEDAQTSSAGKPLVTAQAQVSHGTRMGIQDQRMQQATLDKQHLQTLNQLGQDMGSSDSLLDVARNDVTMRNMRTVMGGFNLRAPVTPMADSIKAQALAMQHKGQSIGMPGVDAKSETVTLAQENTVSLKQNKPISMENTGIGKLSQQFESGSQGISAIGYDRVGGTSYGKYQIASRVGSMDNFLNFLDTNAPDIAQQLRTSGPSNTGSRQGAMPDTWRQIAADQPERFEALQEKFIYDSHYKPAVAALRERSSLDGDAFSPAMQEVLFSTAVQHGPTGAARIFSNAAALSGSTKEAGFDSRLINNIYDIRSEQFGASTAAIQESARNRMHREKGLALAMLQSEGTTVA